MSRYVRLQACALAFVAGAASAATVYWDPDKVQDGGPNGADGGGGAWTAAGGQWWNGSAYVSAGPADTCIFEGTTGGEVTAPGALNWLTVNSLRWMKNGYCLAGPSYMTVSNAITVDRGVTVTLAHRAFGWLTVNGGGTLIYQAPPAAYLGSGGGRVSIADGTTVDVRGGGISCGNVAATTVWQGSTLILRMAGALTGGGNNCLAVHGFLELIDAANDQGTVSPIATINLKNLALGYTGTIYGRGADIVLNSHSVPNPAYGVFDMVGGTFDTGGGNVGVFLLSADDFDFTMSGGAMDTGRGRLVFGGATAGSEVGRVININLSGGASIAGKIDLGNANTPAGKVRVLNVGDGGFTIAAAIADGGSAGCGLVKTGSGTLTLGGTNTYTGPTTVKAGTLRVDGRQPGRIVVADAATLDGSGSIAVTNVPLELHAGATLAMTSGLSFDVSGMTAPVTVVTNRGGTIAGFNSQAVTTGWYLYTNATQMIAGRQGARAGGGTAR